MTDGRRFYTDPRIAGYMHETFGMRFVENFEIAETYIDGVLQKETFPARLFIHADSMHLLQPREGDSVATGGGNYHFLCGNSGVFGTPLQSLPQAVGPLGMKQLGYR